MQIKFIDKFSQDTPCSLLIIFAAKQQIDSGFLKSFIEKNIPVLDNNLALQDFKGDFLQQILIYPGKNFKIERIMLTGLGDNTKPDKDYLRTAAFHCAIKANELKSKKVVMLLGNENSICDNDFKAISEGLFYQNYEFSYKNEQKKPVNINYQIFCEAKGKKQLQKNILHSMEAVRLARNLSNQPANILTPVKFVGQIEKAFKKYESVKIDIYDKSFLVDHQFNALLSVARGSKENPYLIKMHYKPTTRYVKKIVLIGKGITFDSGGISIKPALNMEEMKYDMAGAAAVAGIMHYVGQNKPDAEIIGLIPALENMPGGSAVRPGDIVKAYNGKTIEIINTDAEGRLILSDTLAYTCKQFKPDLVIDLATLTGSVMVTLADKMAGMFTEDDEIAAVLEQAGNDCAERVWRLPLSDLYKKQLESKFADIKNVGERWGGAITAALFLKEFVEDTRWVHLDIAGVANDIKDTDYLPHGATGYGVKLIIEALPELIRVLKNQR